MNLCDCIMPKHWPKNQPEFHREGCPKREALIRALDKYLQALYDAVIALREADGPHWINLLDELFDAVDATGEVL